MSRYFRAKEDYLRKASSFVLPTTTGTLILWIYPTWAQGDNANHEFLITDDSSSFFNVVKTSLNDLRCGWYVGANNYRLQPGAGTFTLNQNAWNLLAYTWDTATPARELFLNNSSIASSGAANGTYTSDKVNLGGDGNRGEDYPCQSYLAHLAVWDRVLTGTELTNLNGGDNPASISSGLVYHFPINGQESAELDTVSGGSTFLSIVGYPYPGPFPAIDATTDFRIGQFVAEVVYNPDLTDPVASLLGPDIIGGVHSSPHGRLGFGPFHGARIIR